jgi:hypothetical protein
VSRSIHCIYLSPPPPPPLVEECNLRTLSCLEIGNATEFWWKAASLCDNIKIILGMQLFGLSGARIMPGRGGVRIDSAEIEFGT